MHEFVDRLAGGLVDVDGELEQEFEARLVESSRLAFRVAYGVLRHREDAEDVAQEAFTKALPRPTARSVSCAIENGFAPGLYA
jgi:DNA-directed RNA polymerase specialized sigma24 family protein